MIDPTINIDKTLMAVCNAIASAEMMVKEQVKLYYPNANEEFITFAFYSHIKHKLQEASQNKSIERAFLEDLKIAMRRQQLVGWELERQVNQTASGLIADIVLHNRRQESVTGGDFGLVIVHPQIIISDGSFEIRKGESSGLLCQAKLKGKNGRWGSFTKRQKRVLPGCMDFCSLLLYSYLDEKKSDLNSVAWKLCKGSHLSEIENLLRKNTIAGTLNTSDVVARLGRKDIGTTDQDLIEQIISPAVRQCLELRIFWQKDGNDDPKGPPIKIKIRNQQGTQNKIHVRSSRGRCCTNSGSEQAPP